MACVLTSVYFESVPQLVNAAALYLPQQVRVWRQAPDAEFIALGVMLVKKKKNSAQLLFRHLLKKKKRQTCDTIFKKSELARSWDHSHGREVGNY